MFNRHLVNLVQYFVLPLITSGGIIKGVRNEELGFPAFGTNTARAKE